jgi:hypothetical protein
VPSREQAAAQNGQDGYDPRPAALSQNAIAQFFSLTNQSFISPKKLL